ncbi:MAG: ribose 5-phosphate isomerase A [Chloroflexi bacterium]|nr:ribose 5-phosphate isomerase A [Chloroflexota bacterium]
MVAAAALQSVRSGMTLGLGTGSTTRFFIEMLGEKMQKGELKNVQGVPTSEATAALARSWKIPLVSLDEVSTLDLAVDGADEVSPDLGLIKGLGKALLREKIVEIHAQRLLIIVHEAKLSTRLGALAPLPVEIAPFAARATVRWLATLGCRAELWCDSQGQPYVTDNGHYLARCWFDGGIPDPEKLARRLSARPGVMEHGLFLNMADEVLVASASGVYALGV